MSQDYFVLILNSACSGEFHILTLLKYRLLHFSTFSLYILTTKVSVCKVYENNFYSVCET